MQKNKRSTKVKKMLELAKNNSTPDITTKEKKAQAGNNSYEKKSVANKNVMASNKFGGSPGSTEGTAYKANLSYEQENDVNAIAPDCFEIVVHNLSDMALGSGGGDVNVDSDVVHDKYGLPYFPAKRFKGMLYESAVEVSEMLAACGSDLFTIADVDELFQHKVETSLQLIISNLYLPGYEEMCNEWQYLEAAYGDIFNKKSVLDSYTSLRYQTKIDDETGTAADTSLHNMRVVDRGQHFLGSVKLLNGTVKHMMLLALASRNLRWAGLKRNRGLGEIDCVMVQNNKNISNVLIKQALAEGGLN